MKTCLSLKTSVRWAAKVVIKSRDVCYIMSILCSGNHDNTYIGMSDRSFVNVISDIEKETILT